MSLRQSYSTKDAPARDGSTAPASNRLGAVLSAGLCRPCAFAPTTNRTGVGLNELDQFEKQIGALECNICTYPLQPQSEEEERVVPIYQEHRYAAGQREKYKYWAVACSSYPFPHLFHVVCLAKHVKQTQARVQTCPECRQELANELTNDLEVRNVMRVYGRSILRAIRPEPEPPRPPPLPEALTRPDRRKLLYESLFFFRPERQLRFGMEDVLYLPPSRADVQVLREHMLQIKNAVVAVTNGTAQERSPIRESLGKVVLNLIGDEEESYEGENRQSTINLYTAIIELYSYSIPLQSSVSNRRTFELTYGAFINGRREIRDNAAGVNSEELLRMAGIVAIAYACTAMVSKEAFYYGLMPDITSENASYLRRRIVTPAITAYLFATHPFYAKKLYMDEMLQKRAPAFLHGFIKQWSKAIESFKRDYDIYQKIPSNPPTIDTTMMMNPRGNPSVREAYEEFINGQQKLGLGMRAIIDSMFDFFTELQHAKDAFAWDD